MPSTRLGRPAERQDVIVQDLRQQIVRGTLSPGDRLPTRAELEATFGVSGMTVQRALDRLKCDGFVQVNGRNGTSVAMSPPHLAHYGLVFSHFPGKLGWNEYYESLSRAAEMVSARKLRRLPHYYCLASEPTPEGYAGLEQLGDDIQSHRLAGVITTAWPMTHHLQKLLDHSTIPQVFLSKEDDPVYPCIDLDHDSFWSKSMDYLRGRGCLRIACVSSNGAGGWWPDFAAHAAANNLVTHRRWWQLAHPLAPEAAHQTALLMLDPGQQERPDGLIISDDNFVDATVSGLLEAGLKIPNDIEVVAHCNFPAVSPSPVALKRLGYDARAVIDRSVSSIDALVRGESASGSRIAAVFEEELPSSGNDAGLQHFL